MVESIKRAYGIPDRSEEVKSWDTNKRSVFSLLEKYRTQVPDEIWKISINRINKAFEDIASSPEALRGRATSAFFVHTRRDRNGGVDPLDSSFRELDDSSRCFPILDPQYRIPEDKVELLWNSLPPFKVGEITGRFSGKNINCAIISVPITPKSLEACNSSTQRTNYVRPRIYEAASLAGKMGASIIGLGETLAALTAHGKTLQEKFPDINITTGHAFTTYFMNEWTKFAAEKAGLNLKDSQVTIIGANGSIGSAITAVLLEEGVGGLRLNDKESTIGALRKRKESIESIYPELKGKIRVTGGDSGLREACNGSRMVLVASSSPVPFIKAEHLDKGTFVINDSQPPSITREEAKKAESVTLWVAGTLPQGLTDTFESGLIEGDWTCALEVIALETEGTKKFETVGPVTPERVKIAGEIARGLGMTLTKPQSWGVIEDLQ